jgi:hypothetical protein
MANKISLLQNKPTVGPDTVIAEVVFPTSGQAVAYTSGGDTVDLTPGNALNPKLLDSIGPNQMPVDVQVVEQATDGSHAEWIPGTTIANGKLRLWDANGSEFSGNYGAPWVTGAVILHINLASNDR